MGFFDKFRKITSTRSIYIHDIDVEENGISIEIPIDKDGKINGY